MPRLVPLSRGPMPTADSSYLERVAKYIPGEVIAAFKAAFAILNQLSDDELMKVAVGWIVFVACLIFTPIYLNKMNQQAAIPITGRPLAIQLAIATLSFIVWAYALGGPFAFGNQVALWGGYREWIGGIILILYTLAVGAYKP